jgi:spore germination protein
MYRRLSAIMFPILLVALIGAGVWGYREHQDKNAILIKAENQYQRAFHDLSYHVNKLHTELGNSLAVNSTSTDYFKKNLINVWRLTSQAQNEINQLPLTLLPFNKTEEFLAKIANFSYQTSVRDLSNNPLNEEEMKSLRTLYDHSGQISKDLRDVQSKVLAKNLRWMDVETALATENNKLDNTIIDGFQMVDKKVSQYPEINWGPAAEALHKTPNFQALSGPMVSADEIKTKAAQFLGLADGSGLKIVENGNGTEYNSFNVSQIASDQRQVQLDYSKKGGQLIWYMNDREVPSKMLDVRGARDAAMQFLEEHGYSGMFPVNYDEYQNIASLTMAKKEGDVIVYPAKLTVRVALDDGEVIGLQASDYNQENRQRTLPSPKIDLQTARKSLNPNFTVESDALALIKNELNHELLCYQFYGKINGSNYRIFINADNGMEEKIEQIRGQEIPANQS